MPPELAAQIELSQRYNSLSIRANRAKNQLMVLERAPAGKATPLTADVRTARETMDVQLKAALAAMVKRDTGQTETNLKAAEGNLSVLEKFLAPK